MNNRQKKEFEHPEWSKNANIYEVNLRQYTPEGTFSAFKKHLPRLKEMGVDILWLMPIHPVGIKNCKGKLGSPYAVRDYFAVNSNYGTLDEFKDLVAEIHKQDMKVIIDWVANHTAWDHKWVEEHPEWYKKDEKGNIHSYVYDNGEELEHWTDVIGLDYSEPKLREKMIEALKYWVRETNIDGYRCDVAGLVPTEFWERARKKLDELKDVFMLAEWEEPELHEEAFDMTYDWEFHDLMIEIAEETKDTLDLKDYVEEDDEFPEDAYRMAFTTNHDKNTWEASDEEFFGEGFLAFSVLAATLQGMPLIYGGQESGLDKRVDFFYKDQIEWDDYQYAEFYQRLLKLKKNNPALWNGQYGAQAEVLPETDENIFAFKREKENNQVRVIINFSNEEQLIKNSSNFAVEKLLPWDYKIKIN
ncbi:alpha-amylase family glycosyl hydrolase [Halanaerobacter jeridensis]|uniref:Glycosidase n=1 Tax=Halanaerobacter jeridensis TaxID=706427 RepID=A0A938XP07_9FIRM|nr:alpha-amylase family glycosyl hydrolase [Halanaerobacter jeridensis]MBM7556077.1 glycosidase [Halanaerobacter jeridensis]